VNDTHTHIQTTAQTLTHRHTVTSVFPSPLAQRLRIVACLHMIPLEGFHATADYTGDLGVV